MINRQIPQQAIIGAFTLIIVLFFITAFYTMWWWKQDWQLAHRPMNNHPMLANTEDAGMLLSTLAESHLFGQSLAKSGQIPISSLQFRVTGIVKVDTEQGGAVSKAYISVSGQPGKIYQIGDNLPYGVKVLDINADAVMLENNGRLEKLPLPREQLQFKPRPIKEHA